VLTLYTSSKIFDIWKLPSLLIEITVGIVFGPNIINIVPQYTYLFLEACGKIGLLLLVAESGLKVDVNKLRTIGYRGLYVATLGSMSPFAIGIILSSIILKKSIETSLSIGACFAATSVGITLNIWETIGRPNNNPEIPDSDTKQIIIVAAMIDDVIALILLAFIQSIKNGMGYELILSLIISPLLIIIIGKIRISFGDKYFKIIPMKYRLWLLFFIAFILVLFCNTFYSSSLLGAFLSGFIFCGDKNENENQNQNQNENENEETVKSTLESWNKEVKGISNLMVKFYFAATIAFQIPIKAFFNIKVVVHGFLFYLCIIGKLITGIFAKPFNYHDAIKISFSMSVWGEFAFLVATTCQSNNILSDTEFYSIIFAILLSIILSPLVLKYIFYRFPEKCILNNNNNVQV